MDGLIMATYSVALIFGKKLGSLSLTVGLIIVITASKISVLESVQSDYLLFNAIMLLVCFSWCLLLRLVRDAIIRLPVVLMMLCYTASYISGLLYGSIITPLYIIFPYLIFALHLLYVWRSLRLTDDRVVVSGWLNAARLFFRTVHRIKAGTKWNI